MKTSKCFALFLLTLIILILTPVYAIYASVTLSTDWKIKHGSSYIKWSDTLTADQIQILSDRSTFTNPLIGSTDEGLSSISLYIEGGNATIQYFKINDEAKIQLDGSTGSESNLTIYYTGTKPYYVKTETGASLYTVEDDNYQTSIASFKTQGTPVVYSDEATYLKIKVAHSSPVTIYIGFADDTESASPGGGGGGGPDTESPSTEIEIPSIGEEGPSNDTSLPSTPESPIIPVIPVIPKTDQLMGAGLVALVVIVSIPMVWNQLGEGKKMTLGEKWGRRLEQQTKQLQELKWPERKNIFEEKE